MIILSVTLVPFFYRARVYTAYEYLERRFDPKTRAFTSLLFLLSRGLSCSVIVAAPAVVLSVILGWNVTLTALAICVPAIVYTILGGVQAVTWTDVKVMGLTVFVLLAAVVVLVMGLPGGRGRRQRAARGRRHRAARRVRLPLHARRDLHVLVRAARRPVPDAVVLRLRPEPGAALPDRAVGGPGALLAADERLLEDPAAGAGAGAWASSRSSSTSSTGRRCCSTRCRTRACARGARGGPSTWRSSASSRPRFEARRQAAEDVAAARGQPATPDGAAAGGRGVPAAARRRSRRCAPAPSSWSSARAAKAATPTSTTSSPPSSPP